MADLRKVKIYIMVKRIIWVSLLLVIQLVAFCWTPTAEALTENQQLFNEAWRIVSQAYLDDTFNGQNWWLVRQKALKKPLLDRESTYAAIQQMLASLDDPFTRLLKPNQYRSLQTSTSGELTGVGIQIALNPETGQLEVIAPIQGSPAEQAGILPRDQILRIDGFSTAELTLDEAAERMRGPIGSIVRLTVAHAGKPAGGQPLEIQLRRDRIALNPVQAELRTEGGISIGYIRLSQFNAKAVSEMTQAITRLEQQGASSFILDLRNNPGGLLQAGIEIAGLWLDQGTIVYTVNRQGTLGAFTADRQVLTRDPLVVLVNRGTASASEILAGALQDNRRAQLVGERTFGKGYIQSLFSLSDGSGLAVTIAKYETPNHHDIHKVGILPDQVVPLNIMTRQQMGTEMDQQYQAAVKLLANHSVLAGAAS